MTVMSALLLLAPGNLRNAAEPPNQFDFPGNLGALGAVATVSGRHTQSAVAFRHLLYFRFGCIMVMSSWLSTRTLYFQGL